jgi:hypothetical protein
VTLSTAVLATLLACVAGGVASAAARADEDGGTPLASVHVNVLKPFANLPADAPQGVWYGLAAGQGHGTGCGLILRGSKTIVPLVEPGEDGEWPSCMGVTAATTFDWHGRPVYVYRYLQRDTREDTYTYDAFVHVVKDGIEGIEGLKPDDEPPRLSLPKAAAWAKASLAALEIGAAGFTSSTHDTLLADRGFLVVGRNAATGSCSIVVDRLAAGATLAPAAAPCKSILATTSLSTPQADWLVAMTEGLDGHPQARIFELGPAAAREASDIEATLAPTVAGGKVLAVKAQLKRLLEK